MKRSRAKGAYKVVETKLTEEQWNKFDRIAFDLGISPYRLFRETLVAALMLESTPQAVRTRERMNELRSLEQDE